MNLHCSHCQTAIDLPEGPRFFTCVACGTAQKLVQTESAFYTETVANTEFDLAQAHIQEAKRQRKSYIINALLELDAIWKLREASFMENGKLRITDKNIKSSTRIFFIVGLGATVFFAGYMLQDFHKEQRTMFYYMMLMTAMLVFWLLLFWQSILNSEKEQAYKEAKAQFDNQREQLENSLRQIENLP